MIFKAAGSQFSRIQVGGEIAKVIDVNLSIYSFLMNYILTY